MPGNRNEPWSGGQVSSGRQRCPPRRRRRLCRRRLNRLAHLHGSRLAGPRPLARMEQLRALLQRRRRRSAAAAVVAATPAPAPAPSILPKGCTT